MRCAVKVNEAVAPLREKRMHYESHPDEVRQILEGGEQRARTVAHQTMQEVHQAMRIG